MSQAESRTVKALVTSSSHTSSTFRTMTCFLFLFVDLLIWQNTCAPTVSSVNIVTYTQWMTCTCCLCPMGTRAISQSLPSKALRMFCQSRLLFSSSTQVCLERSVTWPLPPLPSPPLLWIKLPLCRCHGLLDWLPSHLMLPGAQYSLTIRDTENLVLLTLNSFFLGSFKRFQFATVFQ